MIYKRKKVLKNTIKNNLYLLKYVYKYSFETVIWRVINILLGIAVDATLNVMFLQAVVDVMTSDSGMNKIFKYITIVTILMIGYGLVNALYSQYIEPIGKQKIHKGMHNLIFDRVKNLDLEKFDDSDFYNDYIWSLKEVDNRTIKSFVMLTEFLKSIISSGVFVIISIKFDWKFLGFVIVPVIIRMAVSNYKSRLNYEINVELNEINRKKDYARRTFYLKDYAKEIRTYPIAKRLLYMFNKCVDENITIIKKFAKRFVFVTNLETNTYWLFGKVPITIYMCFLVLKYKELSVGSFVAMYSAASKLMYSLASIFVIIPSLRENGLFAEKIIKLLKCKGNIEEDNTGKVLSEDITSLKIKNVSFTYPFSQEKILKDINITVNRGEKVAIVGLNGAGKTTLIKLLLRFYDPDEGSILINENNIKHYKIKEYRKIFSAVFQDFQLYAVSLRENILMRIADKDSDNELKHVIDDVGISEFRNDLDRNVTKEFDKDGLICSGGQKQKLSIARAVFKKSDILILDEASSSLDPISEDRIQKLVANQKRSVIFISHRLSSVKDVDRIYFLENGQIIETGSHEQLMKKNGKYAYMYTLQAEKYELNLKEKDL